MLSWLSVANRVRTACVLQLTLMVVVSATQDRKTLKRINLLIQDVVRNGNEGIGKRGPLKHDFAGYWSRRILDEHRLVYKVMKNEVRIAACRYHYGKQRLALC